MCAGHIPYMPKARVVYQALEKAVQPKQRNIVTTEDGDYWKAVRQGTAPCFSMTNLKKVRTATQQLHLPQRQQLCHWQRQAVAGAVCSCVIGSGVAMGTEHIGPAGLPGYHDEWQSSC